MNALGIEMNAFTIDGQDAPFIARDAIYKMEISDLELYPKLYSQIDLFKDRKAEFDAMIKRQHFMPEDSLGKIVKSGKEIHNTMFEYLLKKIIHEEEVEF